MSSNLGVYLTKRLEEVNGQCFFCVAGDFNLFILDELSRKLRMINCCNELNAGYAADGYARVNGLGIVIVTYMVGGLSALNAIAGSVSDDLPILIISGAPNTHDLASTRTIHHTIRKADFEQQIRCFNPILKTFSIHHITNAETTIDEAIMYALQHKLPTYLEIACNIVPKHVSTPKFALCRPYSIRSMSVLGDNKSALYAAVNTAQEAIVCSNKPMLVAGVKLRMEGTVDAFMELANALGAAVSVMPDAKGLFPEDHPLYAGVYWGTVTGVAHSTDCVIFAGPLFNDCTTEGWSFQVAPAKCITANPTAVNVLGTWYSSVCLVDFLLELAKVVPKRPASLVAYHRIVQISPPSPPPPPSQQLVMAELCRQLQGFLTPTMDLICDSGDSWFIGQRLHLPRGAKFHVQMQYGSIGWSIGAALGMAVGLANVKTPTSDLVPDSESSPQTVRDKTVAISEAHWVVVVVGDGAFQMTAQELSTIIREKLDVTVFLINNGGYTTEVEIHDGPYNVIQNWDYCGLVKCFAACDGGDNAVALSADTAGELSSAIEVARSRRGLVLVEARLMRDDCTAELLQWGSRVAAATARL